MTQDIQVGTLLDSGHPFYVKRQRLKRHMLIVAQSGSGKSFFLGRLLEEILCQSLGKILIFDLNSDFIRLAQVNQSVWKDKNLKHVFAENDTYARFKKLWQNKGILTLTNQNLDVARMPIRVNWGNLSFDEMVSFLNLDMKIDYDLYLCFASNYTMAKDQWQGRGDTQFTFRQFFEISEQIAKSIRDKKNYLRNFDMYDVNQTLIKSVTSREVTRYHSIIAGLALHNIWLEEDDLDDGIHDVSDVLFRQFLAEGAQQRVISIDLQSLNKDLEKYLTVSRVLSSLWVDAKERQSERLRNPDQQDKRVPIFIVIDEAHNLVPTETRNILLQGILDQITRIAAEGRKYGLFWILSTQRPKKLAANVISECDNLCVLRIANLDDLQFIRTSLGSISQETVQQCLTFKTGDALLSGNLVDSPTRIHAYPRRTVPGGSDLSDHWLQIEPD